MGTEIDRKLATIRRVAAIDSIPGADRIVCATIDGWKLVTQKSNNFQVGDLVVYFEIDSFLPIHPAFDFLYDGCYKNVEGLGPGYRLRTIKLRKQISQGLILPLRKEIDPDDETKTEWHLPMLEYYNPTEPGVCGSTTSWDDPEAPTVIVEEGDDVTQILGVRKYEAPIPASLAGVVRSTFPGFIHKTDQERAQNILGNFRSMENESHVYKDAEGNEHIAEAKPLPRWQDHTWEVTMKVDGSSCTIFTKDGDFGVCSRNMDLVETEGNAYWKVARKYQLEEKLDQYQYATGRDIAIQGELMGPGVQGNRENLSELDLYVFDIFDIEHQTYLTPEERADIIEVMGLKSIPVISTGFKIDADVQMPLLLDLANINSINHLVAEGIVFKSEQDPNVSFKVINDRFLLDEGN